MVGASEQYRNSLSRRSWLGAAAAGLASQPLVQANPIKPAAPKSVIYIFLSGGLGQHESFDLKPHAAADIRGEFLPIATQTPGLQVCEHMPLLAARSNKWSVVRSLSHPYNEHSQGHMVMLSGRSDMPVGFSPVTPRPTDHPSIAALMGTLLPERSGLLSSIVLPEKLIHRTGRVIPGQFAGVLGSQKEPWFLSSSRFNAASYGAWPEFHFSHQGGGMTTSDMQYRTPGLALPEEVSEKHFEERLQLLSQFEQNTQAFRSGEEVKPFDKFRERALSMLGDGKLNQMFDIHNADAEIQDRYGRNTFGWSLMLARRLVEAGVGYVQVNLGNNETWDTHGNAFSNLKQYLLPPMDRCVSALLDDLDERGLLDSTLVVMAGEFGRAPRITHLPAHYAAPGRDHWGAVQSLMLAGCGFDGGKIIGATDNQGGQPRDDRKSAENLAATMYSALGIPRDTHWYDHQDRPHGLYRADPIPA